MTDKLKEIICRRECGRLAETCDQKYAIMPILYDDILKEFISKAEVLKAINEQEVISRSKFGESLIAKSRLKQALKLEEL